MIELTKEEALDIIKALSRIEGFLYSIENSSCVMELADYSVNMLCKKLEVDHVCDKRTTSDSL